MKRLESALTILTLGARGLGVALIALTAPLCLVGQDLKRAQAARAELQASLAELDQYIASPGYSGRLREEKRREAGLIRARLEEGDLQVGDNLDLTVVGETAYTGNFMIGSGRVLALPGLPDIPLTGVLRSEAQDYLKGQLAKYVRDPQVRVRTSIRLSVFGSVGKPGFYQIPADVVATDAFMLAGGLVGDADPTKAFVRRGGQEIWPQEAFRAAMQKGLTLDQLNLRAGDELILDPRKRGGISFFNLAAALGAVSSTIFLFTRFF